MNLRIVAAALLLLILVGCGAISSCQKQPGTPPAKSVREPLRGLQSLTRVRVELPGVKESVRKQVLDELHKQLPQLDIAGAADDWTLEFAGSATSVDEGPPRSTGPNYVSAVTRYCRLTRSAVVDGRAVTAVAYQGFPVQGEGEAMTGGHLIRRLDPDNTELLLRAVADFAQAWRAANPNAK